MLCLLIVKNFAQLYIGLTTKINLSAFSVIIKREWKKKKSWGSMLATRKKKKKKKKKEKKLF